MMQKLITRLASLPQLAALRHRNFRLLWAATLLSSTARWADLVVVGWLTLELTDSPLMVGIVAAAKMAGYLAAPFMGVVADRMDRRLLMVVAAGVNLAASAAMLLLFAFGVLELWQVIALALVGGLTWALDSPTRQAFVPDLVRKEDLANAVALNSVAMESTVVIGPALGGLLIPVLGMTGAYVVITAIYLADVIMLLMMRRVRQARPRIEESPLTSLISGLKYAWTHQVVLTLLVIACVLNLFAAPFRHAFMPLFARYVLDAGPAGYGMLTAMAGVGALVAGVWLVAMGNFARKGALLIWSSFIWSAFLLFFAMSTSYYLSMVLVFVAGFMQAICWTMIATLLLSNTAQEMRGRMMGLRIGVVISLPLGNLLGGAAAEHIGAPLSQGAYALGAMLIMLIIVLRVPGLRRLE